MSPPPLVSVVAIFLNGERFLDEAIQSVIAQTYPHWELLLVDDGSTDGSTELARRHGPSATRTACATWSTLAIATTG